VSSTPIVISLFVCAFVLSSLIKKKKIFFREDSPEPLSLFVSLSLSTRARVYELAMDSISAAKIREEV